MLRDNIFGGVDNLSVFAAKYQRDSNQQNHFNYGNPLYHHYAPQSRPSRR
jgi:hypothetical protein